LQGGKSQNLLWSVTECPYQVAIPAELLVEIRGAVVEAYYSVPRGGVEIGGVFFGTVDENSLHIQAYRPIRCQYLYGPAFKLSGEDKLGLPSILNLPGSDAELAGLTAVGWYHSHNRSEIFLSAEDLQLYREFFPERWQIALVLRPAHLQPTRAGFFFRDLLGGIKSDAPVQGLVLEPPDFGFTRVEPETAYAFAQTAVANTVASDVPVESAAALSPAIEIVETPRAKPDHEPPPLFGLLSPDMPERETRGRRNPFEQLPRDLVPPRTETNGRSLERVVPEPLSVRLERRSRGSERRAVKREPADGLFAYYWDGGAPRRQRIRDISLQGSYVETDFPWMRGTLLLVTLQIGSGDGSEPGPADTIMVPAEIVRTSRDGMGLKFLIPSDDEMRKFLEFLARWNPATAQQLLGKTGS
jgi:proteasome lid subunit RPN8/RPN11